MATPRIYVTRLLPGPGQELLRRAPVEVRSWDREDVPVPRDVLLRDVWGYGGKVYTRTVDVRIANLRQQLEDDPKEPKFILTVQGLGYKFRPEGSEP